MQVGAKVDEVLDIVEVGEYGVEVVEELGLGRGQVFGKEELEKVAEVVSTVEGNPPCSRVEKHVGRPKELSEVATIDAKQPVALEVHSGFAEKLYGFRDVEVLFGVELAEIELPYPRQEGAKRGKVPGRVGEGKPHLDKLHVVHICFHLLVVVVV